MYWKLHDKREQLVARLKECLDGLPPGTRRHIVLRILAAFVVLALCTSGRVAYGIGRNDDLRTETERAGRVELSTPVETDNYLIPCLYGADKE